MKVIGELERELIVDVRVVAQPGEQHHRLARAAPVQHLQLDPGCDLDEADLVRRVVRARRRLEVRCQCAVGAANASSATAPSKDSRNDCIIISGILPNTGRPPDAGSAPDCASARLGLVRSKYPAEFL